MNHCTAIITLFFIDLLLSLRSLFLLLLMLLMIMFLLLFDYIMYHQDGCTAFHLAASGGHTEIVKLLLDRGVNVDTADSVSNIRLDRQIMTMCV